MPFRAQCDNQGIIGEVSAVIEGNRTLIRLDFLNVADAQVNVRAAQKLVERQSYCFLRCCLRQTVQFRNDLMGWETVDQRDFCDQNARVQKAH